MTAVTLVESHHAPIPGMKKGQGTGQDDYTTNFGFKELKGAVLTSGDNDDVIMSVALSSGDGTVHMYDDEGNAVSADTVFYYVAWGE